MKRSQALIQLSREHHSALVLARRARKAIDAESIAKFMAEFPAQWNEKLLPHFAEEERMILPQLVSDDARRLAERFKQDHAGLRNLAKRIMSGEAGVRADFGKLLADHVSFEEHELFPYYERLTGVV